MQKAREQGQEWCTSFVVVLWEKKKKELKSKQTQVAKKGSLCFAKCPAPQNISNEMLLTWHLPPALEGKTVSVVT